MCKISDEIITFKEETKKKLESETDCGRKNLADVKIQRGIFQGNALLPFTISNNVDAIQ